MAHESFTPPPPPCLRPPPWGLWGASTYLLWPSRHEEDAKWKCLEPHMSCRHGQIGACKQEKCSLRLASLDRRLAALDAGASPRTPLK